MSTTVPGPKGLEGITAANSGICYIDGDQGVLAYRGIDIHDLADHSTFEEVCYLLWFGRLPSRAELLELKLHLARERKLDASIISLLRQAPAHALPMDVLRTTVSALSYYDPRQKGKRSRGQRPQGGPADGADCRRGYRLRSHSQGQAAGRPDRSLSHAGNFLYMLNGEIPSETAERALDIALILHADHELNASTFAARVIAATLSDMYSAVTAAIGALKGPLHGGANEAVFRILEAIDPRAPIPSTTSTACWRRRTRSRASGIACITPKTRGRRTCAPCRSDLGQSSGDAKWFEISHKIEEFMTPCGSSTPNVDFYSAFNVLRAGHRHRPVHADLRRAPVAGGRRMARATQ